MAEKCADQNIPETENNSHDKKADTEMKIAETVIYLASCAVNGTKPETAKIAGMDLDLLFSFASYHMLSAVVAMALERAGCKDGRLKNAISFSVRKATFFEAANHSVLKSLNEAGIWYMPLKGAVLKNYYPRFGMREMSDYDILFDVARADDVRRIMKGLGFTVEIFGTGNHDVYYKKPLCNFEMHRELFSVAFDERIYDYYADVKSRLIKDEGDNSGNHFSPEDFYVYMTAHEYKHYSAGGTGLRSLLDMYVFLKHFEGMLDFDYISEEIKKLGISYFEKTNRSLAVNLFGCHELMEDDREMFKYILNSGAYGTLENSVSNKVKRFGGGTMAKMKFMLLRIFPPIYHSYLLYPFLIIYRLIKALTWRWRETLQEVKILFRSK
ncbi:MAG: nucleotidyltransferase family protein [Synergistaceae bacterium]|nr:nucleotidyltransferase family protein [Synergistaceae bacterium]